MGLLGKGAYLGDNWNRLDGIVVVLSLLPYAQLLIPSLSKSEGIKLIRIVRVLRPLRTVTSVEGETSRRRRADRCCRSPTWTGWCGAVLDMDRLVLIRSSVSPRLLSHPPATRRTAHDSGAHPGLEARCTQPDQSTLERVLSSPSTDARRLVSIHPFLAGMRKLVITLLESMPQLMDVGVLLSFAFFIFGIVGVQLFSGSLAKRCMIPVGLEETYDDAWPMQAHLGEPIENSTTPASWWLPEDEYQEICSAVAVRLALPSAPHPRRALLSSQRAAGVVKDVNQKAS
jgi:hypothetical protein